MKMFKKLTIVFSLAGAMLGSVEAFAAIEKHTFEVSVTVPTLAFYVLPADPDWIHREQRLPWNVMTSTLGSLRKSFDVKNEAGSIEARLESRPYLSNGTAAHDIALAVLFNGRLLSERESIEIVDRDEAALGKRVLLEIVPVPPDGVYKPGDFFGSVNMIFNAVMPDS
jgi:hypothetical protein